MTFAPRPPPRRNGDASSHWYEFGSPPPVLEVADGLVTEISEGLSSCTDNELLTLDPDCAPF